MKKPLYVLLLGMLAILVSGTILKVFLPAMIVPNFLAIILVYLAFHEQNGMGAALAFGLGLELDLLSAELLGPWSGAYVITYIAFVLSSKRIFTESFLVEMIATSIASIMTVVIYQLIMLSVNSGGVLTDGSSIFIIILDIIIEAALAGLCAPCLIKVFGAKSKRSKDSAIMNSY